MTDHYYEQREQLLAEIAANRPTFAAQRDQFLNRAINEATPISIRDLLAGLVAAVERMANAVERMAPPEITGDAPCLTPRDWPDAPHPLAGAAKAEFTPDSLAAMYAERQEPATRQTMLRDAPNARFDASSGAALPSPREVVKAIESVSWFGCTHRLEIAADVLTMTVTAEPTAFEKLAELMGVLPSVLRDALQAFDRYESGGTFHRVTFPADWVRSA